MSDNTSPYVIIITAIVIALTIGFLAQSYGYLLEPNRPAEITTSDYIGKVIQVDHQTTTSGGLFFSSSRTDTYVTFANGQTYWKPGYEVIIKGFNYTVHSVKTVEYGPHAMGNGTLTTIVNTFSEVP